MKVATVSCEVKHANRVKRRETELQPGRRRGPAARLTAPSRSSGLTEQRGTAGGDNEQEARTRCQAKRTSLPHPGTRAARPRGRRARLKVGRHRRYGLDV